MSIPNREEILTWLDYKFGVPRYFTKEEIDKAFQYSTREMYEATRNIIEKYGNFGKPGHDVDEFYKE